MFGWRRKKPAVTPIPRLSAAQAIAIAETALDGSVLVAPLSHAVVEDQDGALVWTISPIVLGRQPLVQVNDATGDVLSVRWVGLR